jgi:cysteinyl-tRNA synthetase
LFDTLQGAVRPFDSREPGVARMYTCGPTVYNFTHIGHLRPAVVADVLARHLSLRGYRVTWVTNFTDIDDKIIARAQEEGEAPAALAQRYIDDYLENLAALGIDRIERFVRVTDHMPDIVDMIGRLVAGGFAYQVDGDVYFAVEAKADYGKLSGRTLGEMRAGARVEVDPRKRHPMDFALWKAAKPGEPSWPSPWGAGRPGWHIECSAMSLRYLGNGFDIHGGGADLIFPHHENEVAQAEAATGVGPFVRFWVHNAMVEVDREKMSKSLGNFVPLRDLVAAHPGGALRFFVLSTHYRKPLQYSASAIDEAQRAWTRLVQARAAWLEPPGGRRGAAGAADLVRVETVRATDAGEPAGEWPSAAPARQARPLPDVASAAEQGFLDALDDDLNTAGALGHLFELVRAGNAALAAGADSVQLADARGALERCGEVLGLWVGADTAAGARAGRPSDLADRLIRLLVDLRAEARSYRDWTTADRIRDGLAEAGVSLDDTPSGTRWRWSEAPDAVPGARP